MKQLLFFLVLTFSVGTFADVQYFFGKTKMWTPDKRTALGESPYLMKRELNQKLGVIVETAISLSRKTGSLYEEHTLTLKQTAKKSKFKIVDKFKKLNGHVLFKGDEWKWNHWTYVVAFKNGDKIVGEGSLSKNSLKSEKLILSSRKSAKVLIVEELQAIDERTYKLRLDDFVTGKFLINKR